MDIKFKHKILLAIIGFIGACLIIILISLYGVGVSPDSVYYISVARHIADGTGFVGYDGYYFVLQPPLYPLLLAAIIKIFSIDPLISAGYLNAILFGLIVYYSGLFLLNHLKSLPLIIIGTLSIMVSFVIIQISLIALSEPLFILFVLLYLNYFDNYRIKGTITSLLFFSTAAALACLTRYVGVIIILTGSISIFIWKRKTFKELFQHLIIFLLITILPTGLWILRNYLLSGTFVGQRADSSYTLSENLLFLFNVMLKWYLPIQINEQQLFFIMLIISAGIFAVIVLSNKWKKDEVRLKQIGPSLIFILFYSGIIVISSTTTAYDKIANRLLSPIFVPSFFIMFLILDNILEWISKYFHQRFILILFLIGIIAWMKYPVTRTIYNIEDYIGQAGWEYSSKAWRDNTVIRFLNSHKQFESGYSFYSNVPEAVYILANKEVKWSPPKTMYNSPELIKTNPDLRSIWQGKNEAYLVWFNNINRNFLFTIDELKKSSNMVKIAQLKDGEIYKIVKK
ncbi:MAG: ArnT family glycosyltransferase [Ignavibacteriaceae bacterium]